MASWARQRKTPKKKKNAHNIFQWIWNWIYSFSSDVYCGWQALNAVNAFGISFHRKLQRRFFQNEYSQLYFQWFIGHFYIRFTPVLHISANFDREDFFLAILWFEYKLRQFLFKVRWPHLALKITNEYK